MSYFNVTGYSFNVLNNARIIVLLLPRNALRTLYVLSHAPKISRIVMN